MLGQDLPVAPVLPVLPLEEPVVFPGLSLTLELDDSKVKNIVSRALESGRHLLVTYPFPVADSPQVQEAPPRVRKYGILCLVSQYLRLGPERGRLVLEPRQRVLVEIAAPLPSTFLLTGSHSPLTEEPVPDNLRVPLMRILSEEFAAWARESGQIPREMTDRAASETDPSRLADLCGTLLRAPAGAKSVLFVQPSLSLRMEETATLLVRERELLSLKKDILQRSRHRMERNHREQFLQEQIRELQKELGDDDTTENRELHSRLMACPIPEASRKRVDQEYRKLLKSPASSPDAATSRSWLETVASLPWAPADTAIPSPESASEILDRNHSGLRKAKDRLLEYVATLHFRPAHRGVVLCLCGPPGTGKTSLARSFAEALGRPFQRISLGGLRDEAELKGHRRTYLGALPGRIIQSLRNAECANPVILLDEIDKVGKDHRGDPASVLLEILDPEQNGAFVDHYLDIPFDLGRVLFLATANDPGAIPPALRDRIELLELESYTPMEKRIMARDFLIPHALREHGLADDALTIDGEAVDALIHLHTFEPGVRHLSRLVSRIIRKSQLRVCNSGGSLQFPLPPVTPPDLDTFLDPPRRPSMKDRTSLPGLAWGLAWTASGGTVLPVEVTLLSGTGILHCTGTLGDVMKESARIALTVIRGFPGLPDTGPRDIHIHVPEGATPKDGPSAGMTIAAAIMSALSECPLPPDLAMTGELTLTRRILPVGGIREKLMAAWQAGFSRVLIPRGNARDLADLPSELLQELCIIPVERFDDAAAIVFSLPSGESSPPY